MKNENRKLTKKEVETMEKEAFKVIRDNAKRNGITIIIHGDQGKGKTVAALKMADLLFGLGYVVDLFDSGIYVKRLGSYTEKGRVAIIDTSITPYTTRKRK